MNSKPKRVIVISDVHSDYIDQAILILKSDGAARCDRDTPGGFLTNEANAIIESYNKRLAAQETPKRPLRFWREPRIRIGVGLLCGILGLCVLAGLLLTCLLLSPP